MSRFDLGISDDYAVLYAGDLRFYYGYEYAGEFGLCATPEQEITDDYEYGLIVRKDREILYHCPEAGLPKTPREDTMEARLLAAIAHLILAGKLSWSSPIGGDTP